ncbi:MAG TPA: FAD-dependent thymidylate synthase [Aquabacterium sp.]|nr:FAD-dependent thymidylate synthase [Aquabacterium sp.]
MKISVLDHGYVEFIEAWGHGKDGDQPFEGEDDNERGIIEAARQSTQGSFRGWDQDARLLKYLYEHKHATPFEFAGMVIEVQAPLFVFREWHRHRTQSYNEMSARYSPMPDVNYRPEPDRCIVVPGANKQAAGIAERVPTHAEVFDWLENYLDPAYTAGQRAYSRGLEIGIPKEIARIPVAVGRYTRMRASANLRNWLAFLTLRMDPAAQLEIRRFAEAVGQIVAAQFPRTWALFEAGRQ